LLLKIWWDSYMVNPSLQTAGTGNSQEHYGSSMQYMMMYLTCHVSGIEQVKEIYCGVSLPYPLALEVEEILLSVQCMLGQLVTFFQLQRLHVHLK
jgi:hypothetical protein